MSTLGWIVVCVLTVVFGVPTLWIIMESVIGVWADMACELREWFR